MTEWEKWSENKREWQTFSFRFFSFDGRFVTFSGGCERNNNFIGKRVFRIHHCLSLIRLFANARSGKTYGLRIVFAVVCVVHAWDWTRFSRINVNTGKPKAGRYIYHLIEINHIWFGQNVSIKLCTHFIHKDDHIKSHWCLLSINNCVCELTWSKRDVNSNK